jgi:diketogulonate reductase-like aldo/keto reductase
VESYFSPSNVMPWTTITLNDGTKIPTIGYGTAGTGNGEGSVSNVKLAVDTGFAHVGACTVAG